MHRYQLTMTATEPFSEAMQETLAETVDDFGQYDFASTSTERLTAEGSVRNVQDLAMLMLCLRLAYGWARRGDLSFSVETTT